MSSNSEDPNEPTAPTGALGEISQGPGAFETFLDEHHMKILVLGLLAALGVAGFVVKQGIDEGRENAGGNALHQAEDLSSLQSILKNHGDSLAAGSAAILLSERQWSEDQQDAAISTLRTFIDSETDHPAKPTARASLGSKLATQGKTGDAAEVFRELANDRSGSPHLAPFALIALGDISQAAGNIEEAEAHFTRVRDEFATSPFSDAAIRRLQFLKADMPVVVDPPQPEPEPEPEIADETPDAEAGEAEETTAEEGEATTE
jgi:hypothetical protein